MAEVQAIHAEQIILYNKNRHSERLNKSSKTLNRWESMGFPKLNEVRQIPFPKLIFT